MVKPITIDNARLKELFLNAASKLKLDPVKPQYYMCNALICAAEKMGINVNTHAIYSVIHSSGFTRENYYDFIEDNYPDLEEFINDYPRSLSWMYMAAAVSKGKLSQIIDSKKEFLRSLADKL